jgi:hypothetical protein
LNRGVAETRHFVSRAGTFDFVSFVKKRERGGSKRQRGGSNCGFDTKEERGTDVTLLARLECSGGNKFVTSDTGLLNFFNQIL